MNIRRREVLYALGAYAGLASVECGGEPKYPQIEWPNVVVLDDKLTITYMIYNERRNTHESKGIIQPYQGGKFTFYTETVKGRSQICIQYENNSKQILVINSDGELVPVDER